MITAVLSRVADEVAYEPRHSSSSRNSRKRRCYHSTYEFDMNSGHLGVNTVESRTGICTGTRMQQYDRSYHRARSETLFVSFYYPRGGEYFLEGVAAHGDWKLNHILRALS